MRTARFVGLLVLAALILAMPSALPAQVAVSITIAPPVLPVYVQPVCPAPGYIWTPGYWAWGEDGYYWVPGTWVEAPEVGFLWTPGYWGWGDGVYLWHDGYWGPHVGFYGGVVYGFGYEGVGFAGGEWRGREFFYNSRVTNVNVTIIHNTFERNVVVRNDTHVSFNGGRGGIQARPTHEQETYAHEQHRPATSLQTEHQHAASADRDLRASVNHGRPAVAATARPNDFKIRRGSGAQQADLQPEARGDASGSQSSGRNAAECESSGGDEQAEQQSSDAQTGITADARKPSGTETGESPGSRGQTGKSSSAKAGKPSGTETGESPGSRGQTGKSSSAKAGKPSSTEAGISSGSRRPNRKAVQHRSRNLVRLRRQNRKPPGTQA